MPRFRQAALDSFVLFLFTVGMDIAINIPGASEAEIKRGLAAAMAVFDRNDTTPAEVAKARYAFDGWDLIGFPNDEKPSLRVLEIHTVWFKAEAAAIEACCVDWNPIRVPTTAELELSVDGIRQEYGEETARRYANLPR